MGIPGGGDPSIKVQKQATKTSVATRRTWCFPEWAVCLFSDENKRKIKACVFLFFWPWPLQSPSLILHTAGREISRLWRHVCCTEENNNMDGMEWKLHKNFSFQTFQYRSILQIRYFIKFLFFIFVKFCEVIHWRSFPV